MNTAKKATDILRDAEKRLRELVAQAAADGEYDVVVDVADLAKAVGVLVDMPGRANELAGIVSSAKRDHAIIDVAIDPAPPTIPVLQRATPVTRKKRGKGTYPRFYRRNESLIKVGWSKREKTEYEHKAPLRVVEVLAAALAKKGANGKLFTAEDTMPLIDPSDGSEIPGYQVYLTLAWMRAEGLVVQHGRRGYTVKNASHFVEGIGTRWKKLPSDITQILEQ